MALQECLRKLFKKKTRFLNKLNKWPKRNHRMLADLAFQLGSSKHCSRNASLTDESEQSKEGNQSEICDLSSSNGS